MLRVAVPVLLLKIWTERALAVLPVRSILMVPVPGAAPSFAMASVTLMLMVGRATLVKFLPVEFGPTATGLAKPEGVKTFE